MPPITQEIIFAARLEFLQQTLNGLATIKAYITALNREITGTTLKMQATTSKGWKTRFKEQIIGLKNNRLALQREADSFNTSIGLQKARLKETKQAMDFENDLNSQLAKSREQFEKLVKPMTMFGKGTKDTNKSTEESTSIFQKLVTNFKQFAGVLQMPQEQFKKFKDSSGRLDKNLTKNVSAMGKFGLRLRKMTHGFRGFRMEMLGVMFFGQAISRIFMGMIAPALELVGVFDIFKTALAVLFLPVALLLLDWALWFMDKIMNMSESTKKWIGILVLAAIAIGGILSFIGAFALGIGSLILIISPLITLIGMIISGIISFGGAILGNLKWVGLIIAGLLMFFGIVPAVGAVSDKIEEQGGIFSWLGDIAGSVFNKILGLVDRLWEKFLDWGPINRFLEGIGLTKEQIERLHNPIAFLGEKITGMWDGFLRKNPEVIKKLGDMGLTADEILRPWNNLGTVIPKIIEFVFDLIQKKFSELMESLKNSFKEMIESFKTQNPELLANFDKISAALEKIGNFLDKISSAWDYLFGDKTNQKSRLGMGVGTLVGALAGMAGGPVGVVGGAIIGGAAGQLIQDTLSSNQVGGSIPYTGMYRMHAGETVMPSNYTMNFSPSITVSATSNVDIDYLQNRLSEGLRDRIDSLYRR